MRFMRKNEQVKGWLWPAGWNSCLSVHQAAELLQPVVYSVSVSPIGSLKWGHPSKEDHGFLVPFAYCRLQSLKRLRYLNCEVSRANCIGIDMGIPTVPVCYSLVRDCSVQTGQETLRKNEQGWQWPAGWNVYLSVRTSSYRTVYVQTGQETPETTVLVGTSSLMCPAKRTCILIKY